ncbi:alpha-2B adrenergic receptor [Cololabis saira]|uniref:alpha-2B adrenergic receptor n=1 Tax=Cololabis saira TaxID=129043 RepID=UPI002AD4B9CE|nr:alpha-2B adrenergic receptor [Cololabis saira]
MADPEPPCLSGVSGNPHRNVSVISATRPCNRTTDRHSPYTTQATTAFAMAITFMMIVTIFGNILVIMAVLTSRSLKGAQNLFLVSLAAADILVATLIIPFSLANELQGYWAFGSIWCEVYLALDVLFCSSSIVHLCAISLDRYLSISRPMSYRTKCTPAWIKAAIIAVWLISAVISFPPLLSLDKSLLGEEVCELNNERWYILYSTIGSFFVPCIIMILVYMRIYQIAKQHTRCPPGHKVKGKPEMNQRGSIAAIPTTSPEGSTPSSVKKPDLPHSITAQKPCPVPLCVKQADVPQTAYQKSPNHGGEGHFNSASTPSIHNAEPSYVTSPQSPEDKIQVLNLACRRKSTMTTATGTKLASEDASTTQGTTVSRRKTMAKKEKRFTFVLAVVMGVFVVCWFPFFLSYSLKAVCPQTCNIPEPLFKFFFWIGYCNSCLNPVIYTIFNKDFRMAFKRILYRDMKGTFF